MKVKLSNQGASTYRIYPFIKNVIKYGHFVQGVKDYDPDNEYDIWLIEYLNCKDISREDFFNGIEKELLSYKGKIIFFSLDDDSISVYEKLKPCILDRVDVWFIHTFYENDSVLNKKNICNRIIDKYIQLPMYNSYYISSYNSEILKENKIYFKGYSHNKSERINLIKKIKNTPHIKENFIGGLYDKMGDEEIFSPIILSIEDYINDMSKYSIGLCPPGHTRWCQRHIESMACKCCIISTHLKNDIQFLYRNLVEKWFYTYSDDFSDFNDVCEYALLNKEESNNRAEKLNNIYENYFALNVDGSYKDNTWLPIKQKLETLNIII